MRSICEPIFPKDVQCKSRVGLIAGVIRKVLPETIERPSSLCQIIFCDVQGLIRKVDQLGRVYYVDLASTEFYDLLPKINFLRLNRLESQSVKVKEVSRKTIVLLTKGKEGCKIIEKGKELEVPTRPLPEKDPTGAGDLFLGGFAYGILRGYSLWKSVPRLLTIVGSCRRENRDTLADKPLPTSEPADVAPQRPVLG